MSTSGHTPAEWAAKARLEQAAPEMLATLKLIASRAAGCQLESHEIASGDPVPEYIAVNDIHEWALTAIAKAERGAS